VEKSRNLPKLGRVQSQEHGETEKVSCREADGLCCACVVDVFFRKESQRPAVNGNVLRCREKNEQQKNGRDFCHRHDFLFTTLRW